MADEVSVQHGESGTSEDTPVPRAFVLAVGGHYAQQPIAVAGWQRRKVVAVLREMATCSTGRGERSSGPLKLPSPRCSQEGEGDD